MWLSITPSVFLVKVLRAVLVGSAFKPIIDQIGIPAGMGESTTILGFFSTLLRPYKGLVECVSLEAAYCTQRVLNHFGVFNVAHIIALKANEGSLCWGRWLGWLFEIQASLRVTPFGF